MKTMSGKKFVWVFTALATVTAIAFCVMMKQAYDTRPNIQIEEKK